MIVIPYHKELLFLLMCVTWITLGAIISKDDGSPLFGNTVSFIFGMAMGMGLLNWPNW